MALTVTNLIGSDLYQVCKPVGAVGSASDAYAPFRLGTTAFVVGDDATIDNLGDWGKMAQFCRVDADGLEAGEIASIRAGVAKQESGVDGNAWVNVTGVDLVEGDYIWLAGTLFSILQAP